MSEEDKKVDGANEGNEDKKDDKNIDEKSGKKPKEEKLFTQEEVNSLIADRVKRENEKYKDYDEIKVALTEKDTALSEALNQNGILSGKVEVIEAKHEISSKTGVPVEVLRGSSREELEAHAQQLSGLFKKTDKVYIPNDGYVGDVSQDSSKAAFDELMEKM